MPGLFGKPLTPPSAPTKQISSATSDVSGAPRLSSTTLPATEQAANNKDRQVQRPTSHPPTSHPKAPVEASSKTPETLSQSKISQFVAAEKGIKAFMDRPVLIFLGVDFTSSRSLTRAAMKPYEADLAQLVLSIGGRHPVICQGVGYYGSLCAPPVALSNEKDVTEFLNMSPKAGSTCIYKALDFYRNAACQSVLSLGVLIGDTADGDRYEVLADEPDLQAEQKSDNSNLYTLACDLKKRERPLIVAYERTNDGASPDFCSTVAPGIARASGGFAFQLSANPEELSALLHGYGTILKTPPQELREALKPDRPSIFGNGISDQGVRFLTYQAEKLLKLTKD